MINNPFDITKAVDYTDAEIYKYWVDLDEENQGFEELIKPDTLKKNNVETKYVRALNSLGSRDGYGYYGHLQDRTFNLEAQYISGISQKSVCILRKK